MPAFSSLPTSGLVLNAIRCTSLLMGLWLTGCASLPTEVSRPTSTALADPTETRLGTLVNARAARAGTRNDSGFALVGSAELAFTSRMTLIKAAEKTLDLQYYAIHADETTDRMMDALREAAGRGVRVRILLDDFNTTGKNAQVLKLAFERGIEVRLFNPLPGGRGSLVMRVLGNLQDTQRMQRRMHNKIFVADNAVAIAGGRNLGETYFGQSEGTNFIDIDILAAGRIARDLSRSFDQYWNDPLAYPVQSLMSKADIDALKPPPPGTTQATGTSDAALTPAPVKPAAASTVPALGDSTDLRLLTWTWAPSTLLVDKPSKIAADADSTGDAQDTAVDGLLQLMAEARSDVLLVSPYFVPGERMMKQFADIRQRGVRVRVLTNSLASNDAPAAHVGYARYRRALLAMGVELYEMHAEQPGTVRGLRSGGGSMGDSTGGSRSSLHAKTAVIDQRLLVVGSMNLDLRSQLQNSEVGLVISNQALSEEARALIEPAMAQGAWRVELVDDQLLWRAPQGSTLKDTRTEPDASLGLKLLLMLISPFAPEEML
ncbi:phospholipase D family protein [Polaromonas sp. YR568]|uniref:phospholipase D-like domain-containing protein n=1 Tax=Polaromonas sp. YR568 TaxID=1855301 RepID=UPI003137A4F5